MKKRTKQKILDYLGKFVRFLLKLIFVYPFIALWFMLKQIYHVIKELFASKSSSSSFIKSSTSSPTQTPTTQSSYTPPSNQTKSTKSNSKSSPNDQKPRLILKGKKTHTPSPQPLTHIRTHEGSFHTFEDKLLNSKSTIGLILGARGSGKSALGMNLLENIHTKTNRPVYTVGFKPESLPNWITTVTHLDDIPNNSVVLIDEGGIEFSSRNSQSDTNKLLSELLFVARHKDLSILFITQNSSTLEINAIRQLDFLLLKKASLLQKDFERNKIKEMYEKIDTEFQELQTNNANPGLTYIYADSYKGFASNQLPSFWGEDVSKSYAQK